MAHSQKVTNVLQSPQHICKPILRGDCIKKVIFLLLLLLTMSNRANAATLNSRAGAVTTASGPLNVRSSASASSARVASLPKGSHITLMDRSGDWWKVEYGKNQFGYCSASYITPIAGTPVTVATTSGSLNVRSGAGTSHPRIASLSRGEVVIRLSTANGWSRILYHGNRTGYVSAQYLSAGTVSNGPVSLSVPSFKQTDSRWASVTLGTSGKPMSQIGCATTAIAMMESYRQGRTITPDAMAKQLRYTSGGSVYWPSHYSVVTTSSGYLNRMYDLLKQGKPVLLGATNRYGSQHWVVIYGFSGGSLAAANFTIHDPGTYSRTNLQQFLDAYPNFYKYFYY